MKNTLSSNTQQKQLKGEKIVSAYNSKVSFLRIEKSRLQENEAAGNTACKNRKQHNDSWSFAFLLLIHKLYSLKSLKLKIYKYNRIVYIFSGLFLFNIILMGIIDFGYCCRSFASCIYLFYINSINLSYHQVHSLGAYM